MDRAANQVSDTWWPETRANPGFVIPPICIALDGGTITSMPPKHMIEKWNPAEYSVFCG